MSVSSQVTKAPRGFNIHLQKINKDFRERLTVSEMS